MTKTPIAETDDRMLLRPPEAARALGISARKLWGLRSLPRVRIGRSVRYDVRDIQRFIEEQKEGSGQ